MMSKNKKAISASIVLADKLEKMIDTEYERLRQSSESITVFDLCSLSKAMAKAEEAANSLRDFEKEFADAGQK